MINAVEASKRLNRANKIQKEENLRQIKNWIEKFQLESIILNACDKGENKVSIKVDSCPNAEILIEYLESLGYRVRATLVRENKVWGISIKWEAKYD